MKVYQCHTVYDRNWESLAWGSDIYDWQRCPVAQALRLFPAVIIVPTMQIAWTLVSIVSGMVFYQEYRGMSALKSGMFVAGVVVRPLTEEQNERSRKMQASSEGPSHTQAHQQTRTIKGQMHRCTLQQGHHMCSSIITIHGAAGIPTGPGPGPRAVRRVCLCAVGVLRGVDVDDGAQRVRGHVVRGVGGGADGAAVPLPGARGRRGRRLAVTQVGWLC